MKYNDQSYMRRCKKENGMNYPVKEIPIPIGISLAVNILPNSG
jgi:hypothetical protein